MEGEKLFLLLKPILKDSTRNLRTFSLASSRVRFPMGGLGLIDEISLHSSPLWNKSGG